MQQVENDQAIILQPQQAAASAVIWLHGLGADGHDFAGIVEQLGLPENHTTRFVFPHAPVQPVTINGGMQMRSWFDIRSMDLLGDVDKAGIQASCAQVFDLIEQQLQQGIDAENIVLAGFSQGGLVALHAALRYPQQLAGVLALSTYCPMPEELTLHRTIPIMMTHGTMDPVIPVSIAEHSMRALQHQGYHIDWRTYPMEHQLCYEEVEEMAAWLRVVLGYSQ